MNVKLIQNIRATGIFFFMVNRGTLNVSDYTRTVPVVVFITLKSRALSLWHVLLKCLKTLRVDGIG